MSLIPFAPFFTAPFFALLPRSRTPLIAKISARARTIRKSYPCVPSGERTENSVCPKLRFQSKLSSVIAKKIFLNESGNI